MDTTISHPTESAASSEFVLSRTFDAPRDLLFTMWTEAEHLEHWWGPSGMTIGVCKLELRPGGVFHYGMRTPDGQQMWGKWAFREIVTPERIVFVASFADEDGNLVRHPFAPGWPLETFSTLTFTVESGRTTLTMRGIPINATEAELKTFEAAHGGMEKGWTGTLDQLAGYLAKVQSEKAA